VSLSISKDVGSNETDEFRLTEFEFAENNYFILSNTNDANEKIRIEFPFKCENIAAPYSATIYLFKNSHISQNDVIELRISDSINGNGRVGYIFTLAALLDKENSPFNEHSFPFAYYGFEKLVEGMTNCKPLLPSEKKEEYKLSDFYKEDVTCVVLCNENTQRETEFNFDNYLYSLYKYGFIYLENQEKDLISNNLSFIKANFNSIKENSHAGRQALKISKTKIDLAKEIYLTILIQSLISDQIHYLAQFHIHYQVFEILIDEILKNELILQVCSTTEELPGFKLKEKVSKIATDGYRISKLLSKYSNINNDFGIYFVEQLKKVFSLILETPIVNISDEDRDSNMLAELTYKLRNNLVHSYRKIYAITLNDNDFALLLIDVLDCFKYLICEIISTFDKPQLVS
jgi:hypothetical protein